MRVRAVWVWVVLSVILAGGNGVWCKESRVWRDDSGAYRNVVIAIHPSFIPINCTQFFANLKESLTSFSTQLWRATGGHVYLGDVGVVVPPALSLACSLAPPTRATWQKWATADLLVTPGGLTPEWSWGPEGSIGVGVSQPEGCGRPGRNIFLDPDVLQELDTYDVATLGRSLVGAWARYRWGVFEERGYPSHPKFPSVHTMDDIPTPTTCTTTPTKGHWESKKGPGECEDLEELVECKWIPDKWSHVNSSLMYRADLPEMWGFCDSTNHDQDAPTPHNLLCESKSVWEVMNKHPDFATKKVSHKKEERKEHVFDIVFDNITEVHSIDDNDGNVNATSVEINESENITTLVSGNETLNLEVLNNTDTLFLDDVRNQLGDRVFNLSARNVSVPENVTEDDHQPQKQRKKRSNTVDNTRASVPLRPSLVTAHIATSSTPVLDSFHQENNQESMPFPDLRRFDEMVFDQSQEKKDPPSVSSWSPTPPELILLSPAPKAVVLALDLSKHAVAQVNMDDLRGGILRWLWGMGGDVKVGVLAAYNNASYPLTLGPLLPAPTTAKELEDELTLLPSADEVEDGVYGGSYCLECVLSEAVKMLKGGGVETGAGVLLLAACSPIVPPSIFDMAGQTNLFIHTLALCPSANPTFDQLAHSGGSWVLPGLSAKSLSPEDENENEHRAALSLTAATKTAMATPESPTLVRVGSSIVQVTQRIVESAGPYSTLTSRFSLPVADEQLLIVITTQYQAKVIEVIESSGQEIDIIRDTNQRFWAVIDKQAGEVTYTLKFLTSSIVFPFSVVIDVYERKQREVGVEIELYTNNDNHVPLEPGSLPLVVWAKVMQNGRPVVASKVMLTVSHLGQDGSTDMTLQLLDNGNAEPDVRGHDGVYTRYVTWLPGEGRYALRASASDNHGAASVLAQRRRDGRVVPVSAGQFSVTSAVVSVTVLRVTSADITPPSRITDLTVISVHDTTVNLTWSAPGGDLDQGSAWRYELKMYTERSALSEEKFNTSTISVYCITDDLRAPTRTPSIYGTPQHCLTELPFTNLRWYFAIRAVDSANNTGLISNVVSAFVPDPPTTPPPTTASELPANIQTVIMSTITSANPRESQTDGNSTSLDQPTSVTHDWKVWVAVGVGVGGIILAIVVVMICICCCKRNQENEEKDPDRPIYKIYVNNAYIQEEDGEIKVVSNGKLVDDKEPSQVQEWVNSLSKFGSNDYGGENGDTPATATEAPLVECKPRASMKYSSPVRFGVLTNGSIMRETCASSSSTSSSKPSDDPGHEDFKYRDLSETTSNSTTDGGASASSTEVPPVPPVVENAPSAAVTVKPTVGSAMPPPPPPLSQFHQQPLGIPGPTVISIHQGHNAPLATGYTSDEEGGFRPRTVPGPGPRRYLPTHFSSFRYLPPPPEYRSAAGVATATGSIDYPHHTISRATSTLPHGTVRSVKKRRHISFV